jgi:CRP-like cAMP-binding protein
MAQRPQLSIVNYRQGMYIVLEGNHDVGRFFIIQKGRVQLSRGGESSVREDGDDMLNPGDFFGLVSAMSYHSEIETAQAISDVTLVSVARNQFEGLIQFNTPIAMKIIQQFSRRMRYLNNALTNLTLHSGDTDSDTAILYRIAEHYKKQQKNVLAVYAYRRYVQCYANGSFVELAKNMITALAAYDKPNFKEGASPAIRLYLKESPVFAEGENGDELYIIQTGSVKITKIINDNEVILAILKPGDIFGEMAILESKPRSASATAFDNATLMVVRKKNFESMSETQPQIVAKLTQLLAERIWFSYKQLENAAIKDPIGRCYDCMLIQVEKAHFQISEGVGYAFNFGPNDLIKMAGIPEAETRKVISQLLGDKKVTVAGDGKLFISDVMELSKLSEYHKKMQQRLTAAKK